MHLDQQIRGHNADPRSEPTPACNRFEFLIGAMQSIPIIRWTRASSCVLVLVHGPGRGQSDPSSGSRARAGRPRQEHGPILRPVDRTDALRGSGACAPLGSHRERGARADRPAPVPAGRADRAQEMARSQEAPRIPAPGLTASDASTAPSRGPLVRLSDLASARWRHYHSLALPPLGLSDFDLWILGYEFLRHERDSHSPTRMNPELPAEFGE